VLAVHVERTMKTIVKPLKERGHQVQTNGESMETIADLKNQR